MGLEASLFGDEVDEFDSESPELVAEERTEREGVLARVARIYPQVAGLELGQADEVGLGERIGSYGALHHLRAYAAYLERHGRPPATPDLCGEECRELIEVYARVRPTQAFPHLIEHSDVDGWYVPVDFERPAWVAGVGDTEPLWSVGSSQRLLAELDALNEHLGIPGDYGQLGGGEACSALVAGDPWETHRWVWCVLHWLARESVAQRLILKLH
jgi:hypothetical protein